MPAAKILLKEDILRAMSHTKSNKAAAKYLGVSYIHYKKYAKLFSKEFLGLSLFELHKNQRGKGIPKFARNKKLNIKRIVWGRISPVYYNLNKIKDRLIEENILPEKCNRCGFEQKRELDYKVPLLLSFRDGDKRNYLLKNLEFLCYNCYFLHICDVFTVEQKGTIEDDQYQYKSKKVDWQLDNNLLANLKDLGINF